MFEFNERYPLLKRTDYYACSLHGSTKMLFFLGVDTEYNGECDLEMFSGQKDALLACQVKFINFPQSLQIIVFTGEGDNDS